MPNKDVGQFCVQRFIIISSAVRLVTSLVKLPAWSNTMTSKPLFLEFEQREIHCTDSLMLPTHLNSLWMAPLNRHNKWQQFPDSRNAQCKMCNIIRKLFLLHETTEQLHCWTRQSRLWKLFAFYLSPHQIYESLCLHLWAHICESWGARALKQCFSTFVKPRPGKFFFYKTRARSQQIYS